MGRVPIYIVDAFTKKPFGGNQAAVCLLDPLAAISDALKQSIAAEMNLSETAFIVPLDEDAAAAAEGGGEKAADAFRCGKRFSLRWFTPMTEVPLCGHATLASAKIMFDVCKNENTIEFVTIHSGSLFVTKMDDGSIKMLLPNNNPDKTLAKTDDVIASLVQKVVGSNLEVEEIKLSTVRCYNFHNFQGRLSLHRKKLLICLSAKHTRSDLEKLQPNFDEMLKLPFPVGSDIMGVIVTCAGNDCYDFLSRYFAPWVGINEDPVTGSAHSVSGPYWAQRLGKNQLFARQCSKRGGELYLNITEKDTIVLGQAKIVLKGELQL